MTASNPDVPELDGSSIHACGGRFNTGPGGGTCTYCPEVAGTICDKVGSTTIAGVSYSAYGYLSVYVAGGQSWYIDPAGALSFTPAHSANIPQGSQTLNFAAYQGGGLYNLNNPYGWYACRSGNVTSAGNATSWNVFGKLDDKGVPNGCHGIDILISDATQGRKVYQYV